MSQGIEGTATFINKGGTSQQCRIRFPRYITPTNTLVVYNHDLSEAKLILISLSDRKYSSENILMFDILPQKKKAGSPLVFVTDKRIMLLKNKSTIKFNIKLIKIQNVQLFSNKDGKYMVEIISTKGQKQKLESVDYPTIAKCTSFLPVVVTKDEEL